jgi:hypothetical protein
MIVGTVARDTLTRNEILGLSYGRADKVGKDISGKRNSMCKGIEAGHTYFWLISNWEVG